MITRKNIAGVVVASFLFGMLGGGLGNFLTSNYMTNEGVNYLVEQNLKTSYVEKSDIIDAIDKASPSVVSIIATKELERIVDTSPFGIFGYPFRFDNESYSQPKIIREKLEIGGGTGFIVSSDGLLLTNKHVVDDDEAEYTVFMSDGTKLYASVIDKDPFNDFAVVQLYNDNKRSEKSSGLPVADIGDSDSLRIGATVIAIGNALSEFDNTTTAGIVSGKGREIVATSSGPRQGFDDSSKLSGLIQTDASINPGNSGGPLINAFGEVVGINTAVAEANGIGFALPINDAKQILESVKKHGRIIRPFLGVRYIELTPEIATEFELPVEQGALLEDDLKNRVRAVLPDGPADKAGLRSGDIIVAIDGIELNEDMKLQDIIRKKLAGDEVEVEYYRDGKSNKINVELEELE